MKRSYVIAKIFLGVVIDETRMTIDEVKETLDTVDKNLMDIEPLQAVLEDVDSGEVTHIMDMKSGVLVQEDYRS